MSTTTLPITVTREENGLRLIAKVPCFLYPGKTYQGCVFDGFAAHNGVVIVTFSIDGTETYKSLPIVRVDEDRAEDYLRALAELVLAANEVTA